MKIKIYRSIIFPVVLYGYETWSLAFKEGHKLRMFESKVLRKILVFGPKEGDVAGCWRRLHNDKLYYL
jgi:hypothetical protein